MRDPSLTECKHSNVLLQVGEPDEPKWIRCSRLPAYVNLILSSKSGASRQTWARDAKTQYPSFRCPQSPQT
jgi:hypothetical protein